MTNGLLVAGGLVALVIGAKVLVRAGTSLASWLGIRPMMIGLTVVSLGTSVPELAIGIDAAVSGSPGVPWVMPRLWHLAQSRTAVGTMLAFMETRWHHHRSATRPTYFLGRPTSLWLAATGARPDGSRRDDVRPA